MLLQAFYIKSLDEIDTENLPQREIQSRKIAKKLSLFPTFLIYAIFLPIFMILYYCYQPSAEKFQNIIFVFILKPLRWTCYKIIYLFCNLLSRLF